MSHGRYGQLNFWDWYITDSAFGAIGERWIFGEGWDGGDAG